MGNLDGRLHTDGTPLGARDALVAAVEHGYALVTPDRDVEAVPDLDVRCYDETR